jgi:hypothetical protein
VSVSVSVSGCSCHISAPRLTRLPSQAELESQIARDAEKLIEKHQKIRHYFLKCVCVCVCVCGLCACCVLSQGSERGVSMAVLLSDGCSHTPQQEGRRGSG